MRPLRIEGAHLAWSRVGRAKKLAWLALGFSAALLALGPASPGRLWLVWLAGALVSGWLLLRYRFAQPRPDPTAMVSGALEIGGGLVTLERAGSPKAVFAADRVVEGWIEPSAFAIAALRLSNGDLIAVSTGGEAEARSVLEAAGVGAAQQVVRMRLASAASQRRGGRVLGALALAALSVCGVPAAASLIVRASRWLSGLGESGALACLLVGAPLVAVLALAFYRTLQVLVPPLVVVGADGVVIHALGRRRFISYAHVADVTREERGVWLRTTSGEDLLLATPIAPRTGDALHRRIADAMRTGDAPAPAARLELLDRRGRSLSAWRTDLLELSRGASYRHAALERAALVHVLEDPRATAERRVAAALALGRSAAPEIAARLDLAAAACASERLRIAIRMAARDELAEAELDRALEETAPVARRS